jgi:hypothetical protein
VTETAGVLCMAFGTEGLIMQNLKLFYFFIDSALTQIIALNDQMAVNNELERIWKKVIAA